MVVYLGSIKLSCASAVSAEQSKTVILEIPWAVHTENGDSVHNFQMCITCQCTVYSVLPHAGLLTDKGAGAGSTGRIHTCS